MTFALHLDFSLTTIAMIAVVLGCIVAIAKNY